MGAVGGRGVHPDPVAFVTLTLPLDDRLVRLTVLDLGLFEVRGGERVIGIPAYLLETALGRRILFDTGFPPAYATDPGIADRDGLPAFGRLIDLTAGEIDLVILSHGHIDHVGSLGVFTHAPIVMTGLERADPRPSYFGSARPMDWPEAQYVLIDQDTPICAGLLLVPTPGHTPGHLSAILDLPETGRVILAADAINRASEPEEGFCDAVDPDAARTSAARLLEMGGSGAVLIWGHEPTQWPGLRKAPAGYA
ncbi:MAG: hypothetical protein B7Z31_04725 [Rhodobacterales bacterium 12-65-15]|nr:MAG: hypothetical protein B7Z31_04725 [Rhodobacterales bacterium 12-65-15]